VRAVEAIPAEVRTVNGGTVTVVAMACVFIAFPLTFLLALLGGLMVDLGLHIVAQVLLAGAAITGVAGVVAVAVSVVGGVGLVIWSVRVPRLDRRTLAEMNAWRWEAAWGLCRGVARGLRREGDHS
jgi:hypothetical protein